MSQRVNIYDAKAQLSKLIREVEQTGRTLTICRNDVPVVDLVPHRAVGDPLTQAAELRGARYLEDPCAPVGEEDWPASAR